MDTIETYGDSVTVPAQTQSRRTVMTRAEGMAVDITEVQITIPSSAGTDVAVQTFTGQSQLAPSDGTVAVGGVTHTLPVTDTLSPTSTVEAVIDNESSADVTVTVLVTATTQHSMEDA